MATKVEFIISSTAMRMLLHGYVYVISKAFLLNPLGGDVTKKNFIIIRNAEGVNERLKGACFF